jgi:hypothetical protein
LKRLRILELKAARYGINCPPEDQIEIDDLKKVKEELEQKLNLLSSKAQSAA